MSASYYDTANGDRWDSTSSPEVLSLYGMHAMSRAEVESNYGPLLSEAEARTASANGAWDEP